MRFSERMGFTEREVPFQRENMNDDLRTSLWNVTKASLIDGISSDRWHVDDNPYIKDFATCLYAELLKFPIDDIPETVRDFEKIIRAIFERSECYVVYDVIESVVDWCNSKRNIDFSGIVDEYNRILERENSAFRFVNNQLMEVTSTEEIQEIENVFSQDDKFLHVKEHLNQAMSLLAKRDDPDFRNSIKESISAVESLVKLLVGSKGTLGQLLKHMERDGVISPALQKAYSSLYGYTSDANGIRHALMDEHNLAYADARYMLVICSAFVNYVIETVDINLR